MKLKSVISLFLFSVIMVRCSADEQEFTQTEDVDTLIQEVDTSGYVPFEARYSEDEIIRSAEHVIATTDSMGTSFLGDWSLNNRGMLTMAFNNGKSNFTMTYTNFGSEQISCHFGFLEMKNYFGVKRDYPENVLYYRFDLIGDYLWVTTARDDAEVITLDSIVSTKSTMVFGKTNPFEMARDFYDKMTRLKVIDIARVEEKGGYIQFTLPDDSKLVYLPEGIENNPDYLATEFEHAQQEGKFLRDNWVLYFRKYHIDQ